LATVVVRKPISVAAVKAPTNVMYRRSRSLPYASLGACDGVLARMAGAVVIGR
jgi:hypothetical protein